MKSTDVNIDDIHNLLAIKPEEGDEFHLMECEEDGIIKNIDYNNKTVTVKWPRYNATIIYDIQNNFDKPYINTSYYEVYIDCVIDKYRQKYNHFFI